MDYPHVLKCVSLSTSLSEPPSFLPHFAAPLKEIAFVPRIDVFSRTFISSGIISWPNRSSTKNKQVSVNNENACEDWNLPGANEKPLTFIWARLIHCKLSRGFAMHDAFGRFNLCKELRPALRTFLLPFSIMFRRRVLAGWRDTVDNYAIGIIGW